VIELRVREIGQNEVEGVQVAMNIGNKSKAHGERIPSRLIEMRADEYYAAYYHAMCVLEAVNCGVRLLQP
jgi:ferritin-like protein